MLTRTRSIPQLLAGAMLISLAACGGDPLPAGTTPHYPGGKGDTGWVADSSFEVDALLSSTIITADSGAYAGAAESLELQEQLVDLQLKYGKNTMAASDYHLNQLAQKVEILEARVEEGQVIIRYQATADLTYYRGAATVPTLEELPQRTFEVPLPLDPVGVLARGGETCVTEKAAEYNYYYYFKPEGCTAIELHPATLEITRVHPRVQAFPEYDRLLKTLEGTTRPGFRVAAMVAEEPDQFQRLLEERLQLVGEDAPDGSYRRYRRVGEASEVIIDLYHGASFTEKFHAALGAYELVYYHGHSQYGTKPYFKFPEKYMDDYQIFAIHSCRTYSYYARQVLEAKARAEDPVGEEGWARTDFVANIKSSWIGLSQRSFAPLIEELQAGLEAVSAGRPEEAPDWQRIVGAMDDRDGGVYYGVAGVRTNRWRP